MFKCTINKYNNSNIMLVNRSTLARHVTSRPAPNRYVEDQAVEMEMETPVVSSSACGSGDVPIVPSAAPPDSQFKKLEKLMALRLIYGKGPK